jgi:hypothetical protein
VVGLLLLAAGNGCLTLKLNDTIKIRRLVWFLKKTRKPQWSLLLGSVDESASLAQVEMSLLLLLHTLDLEQSGVFVLRAVASLVAGEHGFNV